MYQNLLVLQKPNSETYASMKNIEAYNKIKDYYDYLDFDKDSLLRDNKQSVGLRNLGNSKYNVLFIACYFNVLLQTLFHINHLRERIFMIENNANP